MVVQLVDLTVVSKVGMWEMKWAGSWVVAWELVMVEPTAVVLVCDLVDLKAVEKVVG